MLYRTYLFLSDEKSEPVEKNIVQRERGAVFAAIQYVQYMYTIPIQRHNSLYNRGPVFTYELSISRPTSMYISYSPVHSKPDLIVIVALNGSSCELVPTKMV
jgi:hypothetical protein